MTYKENLFYGASPEIHNRARELRKNKTFFERKLWNELRNKKMEGCRFRTQHPISQFIVDFYCHKLKLVIEVDGEVPKSLDSREYDNGRTFELEAFGLKVIRFENWEIEKELENVIDQIRSSLNK